jgi:hypothetical protein
MRIKEPAMNTRLSLLTILLMVQQWQLVALVASEDLSSPAFAQKVVEEFKPEVRLHEREHFLPSDIKSYLERCDVEGGDRGGVHRKIAEFTPEMSFDEISKKLGSFTKKNGYFLNPRLANDAEKRTFYYGPPANPEKGYVDQPQYADYVVLNDHTLFIQYWFFHRFNGPTIAPNRATYITGIGIHQADWEHVDVYVSVDKNRTLKIDKIFFAGHGEMGHGYYRAAKDIEFKKENTPVVYSALSSHASFHKPGSYVKEFDIVSKNTPKDHIWYPEKIEVVMIDGTIQPHQEWINYGGEWGAHGVHNPGQQGPWRRSKDQHVSIIPAGEITFAAGKMETNSFSLKKKVPTRVGNLCFEIVAPDTVLSNAATYEIMGKPMIGKAKVLASGLKFGEKNYMPRTMKNDPARGYSFYDEYTTLFIRAKDVDPALLHNATITVTAKEMH